MILATLTFTRLAIRLALTRAVLLKWWRQRIYLFIQEARSHSSWAHLKGHYRRI